MSHPEKVESPEVQDIIRRWAENHIRQCRRNGMRPEEAWEDALWAVLNYWDSLKLRAPEGWDAP